MLAVNYSTIRENLKSYCDKVTDEQETVIVTRKGEKNVALIGKARLFKFSQKPAFVFAGFFQVIVYNMPV